MQVFSLALKHQMRECILAIFWPRKAIYEFFKACSVPASILKSIQPSDTMNLSRVAMINHAFTELEGLSDSGTLQFDIMLEMLATWSHFDEYWFVKERKLDEEVAKQKISALRSAKFNRLDVIRKAADDQREREIARVERYASLEEMQQDFYAVAMTSRTPQARGYAFEKFLVKMARYFNLQVTGAFRIKGTQIDGTIKYDGENYNIEAKWEHQTMSDEPLLAFCHKLEINMHGRGLFISINGFSVGALSILERSGVKNTVLMDGEDIALILNELVTFPEALDKKIHAAQTRGQFYIHPVTGSNKISGAS